MWRKIHKYRPAPGWWMVCPLRALPHKYTQRQGLLQPAKAILQIQTCVIRIAYTNTNTKVQWNIHKYTQKQGLRQPVDDMKRNFEIQIQKYNVGTFLAGMPIGKFQGHTCQFMRWFWVLQVSNILLFSFRISHYKKAGIQTLWIEMIRSNLSVYCIQKNLQYSKLLKRKDETYIGRYSKQHFNILTYHFFWCLELGGNAPFIVFKVQHKYSFLILISQFSAIHIFINYECSLNDANMISRQ